MRRLSLFNHEKRIAAIEGALENQVWLWVGISVLAIAVLFLAYVIAFGRFP
jgi:heme exporter protein D